MPDTTASILQDIIERMATKAERASCFALYKTALKEAIKLAERDESIILQLAIRPQVMIKFDAAPERLDLPKN